MFFNNKKKKKRIYKEPKFESVELIEIKKSIVEIEKSINKIIEYQESSIRALNYLVAFIRTYDPQTQQTEQHKNK